MMKKRIVYNEQVKTLMLTVEAIRGYGGLPEEVAEKADEFCMYLNNYIYGNFFASYNIDDQVCVEEMYPPNFSPPPVNGVLARWLYKTGARFVTRAPVLH